MSWVGGGEYFEIDPDGLKIKTVTGGDGVVFFTTSQLREAYPAIAEDAIAFVATGPRGDYSKVVIDQVHDTIVRLRGLYNDSKRDPGACKLLRGRTLGWDRKEWGRRYLHLDGAPMVRPIPAWDERGNLLSKEELQGRHRMAREKGETLRWKQVFVGENELQFRIDGARAGRGSPGTPPPGPAVGSVEQDVRQ